MGAEKSSAWDISAWGTKGKTIPLGSNAISPEASTTISDVAGGGWGGYNTVFSLPFDGEKDLGEIGPIRKYLLQYPALRLRSWQLYLESDVCQALFRRSTMWSIGQGLRLQAKPAKKVLEKKSIILDTEKFNEEVEELFKVFSGSSLCDFSELRDLHEMAAEAWINSRVGGDVLVVMRLVNGKPKVELIDGAQVATPITGTTSSSMNITNPKTGNIIKDGIELDAAGRHVAYWVNKKSEYSGFDDFERIETKISKYPYCQTARMVYGLKYRLANKRGIPLITAVMETAAKMGRYREASLAGAEERAKIAYTIEHDAHSTGENPFISQMAKASGFGGFITDLPADSLGQNLADKVAATVNKQVYNMPIGAKAMMHESKQEANFKDFYSVNFDIVCAVAGYPPEVILSKYNSNYSSSRAAIKDFEHTLLVDRERFANQFYQLVYDFCLDVWALDGTIDAPGYLSLLLQQDEMGLAAYRNAYWAGDNVPHIDPEKEVRAWRLKLGTNFEDVPLCTVEEATEALSGGDAEANIEQASKEREKADDAGFKPVVKGVATEQEGDEEEKPKPKKKDD